MKLRDNNGLDINILTIKNNISIQIKSLKKITQHNDLKTR